jgi:hypothetical protein
MTKAFRMLGTSGSLDYLKDTTSGRRYWLVGVPTLVSTAPLHPKVAQGLRRWRQWVIVPRAVIRRRVGVSTTFDYLHRRFWQVRGRSHYEGGDKGDVR